MSTVSTRSLCAGPAGSLDPRTVFAVTTVPPTGSVTIPSGRPEKSTGLGMVRDRPLTLLSAMPTACPSRRRRSPSFPS
jgi:hypothetical protein